MRWIKGKTFGDDYDDVNVYNHDIAVFKGGRAKKKLWWKKTLKTYKHYKQNESTKNQ